MTVDERMTKGHGSTRDALIDCIKPGMSNSDIGRKYECSGPFIGQKLKAENMENPNNGRSRYQPRRQTMGTGSEQRKKDTAACLRVEAEGRERLMAQVTTHRPGDAQFAAIAAEIMCQRNVSPQFCNAAFPWKD